MEWLAADLLVAVQGMHYGTHPCLIIIIGHLGPACLFEGCRRSLIMRFNASLVTREFLFPQLRKSADIFSDSVNTRQYIL